MRRILGLMLAGMLTGFFANAIAPSLVRAQSEADTRIELVSWKPAAHLPAVLLPRTANETPEQAVRHYLSYIKHEPGLADMLSPEVRSLLVPGIVTPFTRGSAEALFTGVMANTFHDIVGDPRAIDMLNRLNNGGTPLDMYLLAPSAGGRLTETQRNSYHRKLARSLNLYIGMGGEDWTPYLFGEGRDRNGSIDFNPTNDKQEADLRKVIIEEGYAYRAMVCRSMQSEMTLVYDYGLVQDLPSERYGQRHRGPPEQRVVEHNIRIHKTSRMASFLSDYIEARGLTPNSRGFYTVPFNSWHHQAADHKQALARALADAGATRPDLAAIMTKAVRAHAVGFGPRGVLEVSEGPGYFATQGHWELDIPGHGREIGDMLIRGFLKDAVEWRKLQDATTDQAEATRKKIRESSPRETLRRARCETSFVAVP